MNVAVYLRKSREEENETREETLARHERILDDYCDRNNLIIKKKYKEVVSGESIEKRPRMQQLLVDVQNNLYDGVVVIEIERLSRGNQIDQAEILEIFKKSKTKIYTLNKIYDLSSDDEFDEEFFEFGLFMSRREYKVIKRRLMRGREQALKEGYFIGSRLPYGFNKVRKDKGFVLIPNEEEKAVVELIFNKFVYDKWELSQLMYFLNDRKIKPHQSDKWTSKKVKMVLRNKTYIGYLGSKYKKSFPTEWIKGKHNGYIDEKTFNLAQDRLNSNMTHLVSDRTLVNPMASILKCSFCGTTLKSTFEKKKGKYIVRCTTAGCKNISAPLEDVEKVLINELKKELKDFNYFLDNYSLEIEKNKQNIEKEKNIIIKEISKKESMIDRACEMLEEGIYTKEKYLTRVNILESDIKGLKKALNELKNVSFDESDRIYSAIPILNNILIKYKELTPTEKNELLKSLIYRIEYTKLKQQPRFKPDLSLIGLKVFLKI